MTKKAWPRPAPVARTPSFRLADRQAGGSLLDLGAEALEVPEDCTRIGVEADSESVPVAERWTAERWAGSRLVAPQALRTSTKSTKAGIRSPIRAGTVRLLIVCSWTSPASSDRVLTLPGVAERGVPSAGPSPRGTRVAAGQLASSAPDPPQQ